MWTEIRFKIDNFQNFTNILSFTNESKTKGNYLKFTKKHLQSHSNYELCLKTNCLSIWPYFVVNKIDSH